MFFFFFKKKKWDREAGGSGSELLLWKPRYPIPPPMHFLDTHNVPTPRKRVSVLHNVCCQ
jgi:hypothetical protein